MISPFLIISLMFAVGGLVTVVVGRRLEGRTALAWLVQVVGGLVLLAGIAGAVMEAVL